MGIQPTRQSISSHGLEHTSERPYKKNCKQLLRNLSIQDWANLSREVSFSKRSSMRARNSAALSTKSLMSNITLTTFPRSWMNSVSHTGFLGQNVPTDQITPKKSSTNASSTRSPRMKMKPTNSPTTSVTVTMKTKSGVLMLMYQQIAEPFSDFSTFPTHNRGITLSVCTQ